MYEKIAVVMNKSKSAGNYKIERKRVLLYILSIDRVSSVNNFIVSQ